MPGLLIQAIVDVASSTPITNPAVQTCSKLWKGGGGIKALIKISRNASTLSSVESS
jgi:hypothetical protein